MVTVNVKNPSESKEGHVWRQWQMAVLVNLVMITNGLQRGWTSPMAPILQSARSPTGSALSDIYFSWLASSPNLSAMVTGSLFSIAADVYGRRPCILVMSVLQTLGWVLKYFPKNDICFMTSQVVCGLAGGGCLIVIPMYVKELSETKMRGVLGTVTLLGQNLGILIIYGIGGYLDYYTVLWIVTWIPLVNFFLMFKAPESPAYMIKVGRSDEARSVIAFQRGLNVDSQIVLNEMMSINREDEKFKSMPDVSFIGIFKNRTWLKLFLIMILLVTTNGLNGGIAIINYTSIIFMELRVTSNLELLSISVPVAMLLGSILSMVLVGMFRRRVLMCSTLLVVASSFAGLSAIVISQRGGAPVAQWLPVAITVVMVMAFSAGVAPMSFLLLSEMFNFQIRSKLIGCLITYGWLLAFVQVFAYGPITSTFGVHVTFICFSVVNIFGIAIVLLFLPETKDKSVEEIEMELEKRT